MDSIEFMRERRYRARMFMDASEANIELFIEQHNPQQIETAVAYSAIAANILREMELYLRIMELEHEVFPQRDGA